MQNYSAKIKNSTVSRGTCCHGLFYNYAYGVQVSRIPPEAGKPLQTCCDGRSTASQPILQNKANFRKSQMNVSLITTRDYEK